MKYNEIKMIKKALAFCESTECPEMRVSTTLKKLWVRHPELRKTLLQFNMAVGKKQIVGCMAQPTVADIAFAMPATKFLVQWDGRSCWN